MSTDGKPHILAIGGGSFIPNDRYGMAAEPSAALRARPHRPRPPARVLPRHRARRRHRAHRPLLLGVLPARRRGQPPGAVPDAQPRGPRGPPARPGPGLRLRRQRRQPPGPVAAARPRRRLRAGLAVRGRPVRAERGRAVLARRRQHRLVRAAAAPADERARAAPLLLRRPLRQRRAAPAAAAPPRRRRHAARRVRRRRGRGPALRRHRVRPGGSYVEGRGAYDVAPDGAGGVKETRIEPRLLASL